ncbi:hypothetical protein KY284_001106 [Solanum tuberosum]|nr:hypothetical protein KY284_001106 [Solanum tuberosum]
MFEESKKRFAESYTTLATDGVTGIVLNVKQLKECEDCICSADCDCNSCVYGCIRSIDCLCYFCLDEIKFIRTTVEVEIAGKTSVYLLAHELNLQRIGEISLVSGLVSTYVVMKEKLKGMKLRVASRLFDEMSKRNHVQAIHVFIRFQNKFSLVLVENELVVPVWDPGICSGDVLAFSLIVEKYGFSLEEPEAQKMNLVIEVALDLGVNWRNKTFFPSLHYHGMNMALFVDNIILLRSDFSSLTEENVPVATQKWTIVCPSAYVVVWTELALRKGLSEISISSIEALNFISSGPNIIFETAIVGFVVYRNVQPLIQSEHDEISCSILQRPPYSVVDGFQGHNLLSYYLDAETFMKIRHLLRVQCGTESTSFYAKMVNCVDALCARLGFNESNLVVYLLHFEKDKRIIVLPDHVVIKNDLAAGHSRLNHQRVEVQQVWEQDFHKQTGSISWYIGAPVPTSWLVDFGISSSANDYVVKLSKLMKNVRLTFDPGGNSIG